MNFFSFRFSVLIAATALSAACGSSSHSTSQGGQPGSGGTSVAGSGGSGTTTGGSAGATTGGTASTTTGGSAGAASSHPSFPRLVVANANSLGTQILNNVDQLTAGADPTLPDAALSGTSTSVGVAVLPGALAVADVDAAFPIALFSGLDTLSPDSGIPVAQVAAFTQISSPQMFGGPDGTLWLSVSDKDVFHSYPNAETLGSATVAGPSLTHPYDQLVGFAISPGNDRVFAGQISGGGLLAWTGPLPGTTSRPSDFVLSSDCTSWAMRLYSNDLFVTCQGVSGGSASLRIWRNATSLSSTVAPDVQLPLPSDNAFGIDVHGDVVAISTSNDGVLIYTGLASLNASSIPTNTLDAGFFPRKLRFDTSGRLYTSAGDPVGIQVFTDVTSATTRHTLLTHVATAPVDFDLIQ